MGLGKRGGDRPLADLTRGGDFGVREVAEVAQEDDQPAARRETLKRGRELRISLGLEQSRLDTVLERQGERSPPPFQCGPERDLPDPRGERRLAAVSLALRERPGECLLDRVAGGLATARDRRERVAKGDVAVLVQLLQRSRPGVHVSERPAPAGFFSAYVPTTWTIQRRSRSRSSSRKSTRCQVPRQSSPSRTGIDSPAVPSSIAMQCECPLPKSMSSSQMFSVRRSQSSCA